MKKLYKKDRLFTLGQRCRCWPYAWDWPWLPQGAGKIPQMSP